MPAGKTQTETEDDPRTETNYPESLFSNFGVGEQRHANPDVQRTA